jgi:hypothetical protein
MTGDPARLHAQVRAQVWASYPAGADMAVAVAEQRALGHDVLEVDGNDILILTTE